MNNNLKTKFFYFLLILSFEDCNSILCQYNYINNNGTECHNIFNINDDCGSRQINDHLPMEKNPLMHFFAINTLDWGFLTTKDKINMVAKFYKSLDNIKKNRSHILSSKLPSRFFLKMDPLSTESEKKERAVILMHYGVSLYKIMDIVDMNIFHMKKFIEEENIQIKKYQKIINRPKDILSIMDSHDLLAHMKKKEKHIVVLTKNNVEKQKKNKIGTFMIAMNPKLSFDERKERVLFLLKHNVSTEEIAKITSMSPDKIEKIKELSFLECQKTP